MRLEELTEAKKERGLETKAIRNALKKHGIEIDKGMQQYTDKRKGGHAAKIYIKERPDADTRKKITDDIIVELPGATVTFGPGKQHHPYSVMRPWVRVVTKS